MEFEIQTSPDLVNWTPRFLGDGTMNSLDVQGDQIVAEILSPDGEPSLFIRFIFSEIK